MQISRIFEINVVNFLPVGVAEEVGEHVDVNVDAVRAKRGNDRQNVIWSPTRHKCT